MFSFFTIPFVLKSICVGIIAWFSNAEGWRDLVICFTVMLLMLICQLDGAGFFEGF